MTAGGGMVANATGTLALLAIGALVAYICVLWIALGFYVVRDVRRRSSSRLLLAFSLLLGLFPPFLGALIYLAVRPPRTLEDEKALAIEEQLLLDANQENGAVRPCPYCGREIEHDFILCPYCRTQFARWCANCSRVLRLGWAVCPYCAEEVGAHQLTRAGRQ